MKFLRAPDFKEHLRTTACESKPLRCIVFIKAMTNITSCRKVSFNYHLLFHYSRFNFTIVRNLFPCNSVINSFRKWEKPLLCYVVKWNLVSTLTYFANPPCSWSPSAQLFFVSQESLGIVMKLLPSGKNFDRNILTLKWSLMSIGKWSIFKSCQNLQTRISR